MNLAFSKYSGCGNDFILIDNRSPSDIIYQKPVIRHLCHRRLGIGADGLILLESSEKAGFKMRILNADGSEADMCGNGLRCLFQFIHKLGFPKRRYTIETGAGLLSGGFDEDIVWIQMSDPKDVRWDVSLSFKDDLFIAHVINTGVPHAVIFVVNVENVDVAGLGSRIRYHPTFAPQGVNVNFAHVDVNQEIWLRTYERGVEGETLACGTGATATALAAAHVKGVKSPVLIHTRSKERLKITFDSIQNEFHQVVMAGPAQWVYDGICSISTFLEKNKSAFSNHSEHSISCNELVIELN